MTDSQIHETVEAFAAEHNIDLGDGGKKALAAERENVARWKREARKWEARSKAHESAVSDLRAKSVPEVPSENPYDDMPRVIVVNTSLNKIVGLLTEIRDLLAEED